MKDSVRFVPSPDPLYRAVPVDYYTEIPVLGIPVRFESNAPRIVEAAEEAFDPWRVLANAAELVSPLGVRVVIVVHPGSEGESAHAPLQYRKPDHQRVIIHTPGSVAIADPSRREAIAYVTPAFVRDRDHFRYSLLEALTLAVLTQLDRQPFHAAGLVRGETALLLWGPSGAGKSTLCYAALRSGLALLADDVVFLQLESRLRIWGMPGFVHLPLDAATCFPELAGCLPTLLANGKEKIVVHAAQAGALAPRPVVDHAGICVLERSGSKVNLETVEPAEIARTLGQSEEEGFDQFTDTIGPAIRGVAERGGWRLRLAGHPMAAVPLLAAMFDELEVR
ncbi:MAG: hypothetical protein HY704_15585 [Gemmatimonadetes bacterium]|nr:hypothetical protein [Gemmatimonadota bacterium]